tara:strand:- start:338 stop:637 length:300 start_codon:yes stop_codon:yes gene_type:complete
VLLDDDSAFGHFAWQVLSSTLNCAAVLMPEIGRNILPIDDALGTELARIFASGKVKPNTIMSEQDLFDAEQESCLRLARSKDTQARIVSMLDLGSLIGN